LTAADSFQFASRLTAADSFHFANGLSADASIHFAGYVMWMLLQMKLMFYVQKGRKFGFVVPFYPRSLHTFNLNTGTYE